MVKRGNIYGNLDNLIASFQFFHPAPWRIPAKRLAEEPIEELGNQKDQRIDSIAMEAQILVALSAAARSIQPQQENLIKNDRPFKSGATLSVVPKDL